MAIIAFVVVCLVVLLATILLAITLGIITLGDLAGTVVAIGALTLFALAVAFSIAASYVAQIAVSYLIGRLILSGARLSPVWERILSLLIGLLILVMVTAIPFVGGLFGFIAVLFGLGALWLLGLEMTKKRPAST